MTSNNTDCFKSLLQKVAKYLPDKANTSSDKSLNIFRILGVQAKEVVICRLLGEFLSPNGAHGMREAPLDLFFKEILGIYDEENLKNANVILEEQVRCSNEQSDSNRRVDIVVYTQKRIYPIEVKVDAGDQPKQLNDYYRYYFGDSKNECIYYLTPNGHEPSDDSRGELDINNQVKLLSFNEDIKKWMISLLSKCENQEVRSIIKQFVEVIKEMSEESINTTVENIKREIVDSAISKDNYDKRDELNALAFLCSDRERAKALLLDIQTKYILNYFICDGYTFCPVSDGNRPDEYSDEARVYVTKPGRDDFEAWLSVGGNGLYVITTRVKVERWNNGKNKCSWKYIRRGNKYYDMKNFDFKKTDISSELNEVLKAFEDNNSF